MLVSLALIFLVGLALGGIFQKLRLPSLLGMILCGVLLSPYVLDWIDPAILGISAELRKIALVIILTRAGLSLDVRELRKAGRPAILLCFLPASLEIVGTTLLAPLLLPVSYAEAALLGSTLAAVSPAVVVPRMIRLIQEQYGTRHQIPQMILAGASADDVYVIVLFTTFCGMLAGDALHVMDYVQIPTSVLLGGVLGVAVGWLLCRFFRRLHMRDSVKVLIVLSCCFLFTGLESWLAECRVQVSGLIAVMTLGMTVLHQYPVLAKRLSGKYNKIWVAAELMLFVLVGASVDLQYVTAYGFAAVAVVLGGLCCRMLGVWLAVLGTPLTGKERLFCAIAYTPKATVQAAIGAVPLAMGLPCGAVVLTVAVLAILITAPIGAIATDATYKKLLEPTVA